MNFDPLKQLDIRCAAVPEKVELLADNGVWQPVETAFSGDVLTVRKRIACYETVVLKIR